MSSGLPLGAVATREECEKEQARHKGMSDTLAKAETKPAPYAAWRCLPDCRRPARAEGGRAMTPNDVKLALHEVLATGVSLTTTAYLVLFFGWLVGLALAAYAGAFFGKRGETAALKRDLETIKENLRQMTSATEEIKVGVSGDLWERQNRWTFKKDLYVRLLNGLGDVASAVRQVLYLTEHLGRASNEERRQSLTSLIDEKFADMQKGMVEIRRCAFVVPVVCGEPTQKALDRLLEKWLTAEKQPGRAYLEGCREAVAEAADAVTAAAQHDLRLAPPEVKK